MGRRSIIAVGLAATAIGGVLLASALTQPVAYEAEFTKSYAYYLLFRPSAWIIPLAAFLGILARALSRRPESELKSHEGRIIRHDEHMFFAHWSHALSVVILAVSGIVLGFLSVPRFVHTPEAVAFTLNLHFIGSVILVFGLFYWISDLAINGGLKDLLPGRDDVTGTFSYYAAKIGVGEPPKQGKYLASEKLSFPLWVVLVVGITITGGVKTAAHLWSLPSEFMAAMTFLHGVCALGLLAMLALHVLLGAIVPWSWPLLRSMVTGYMAEQYVRENHPLWYEEIEEKSDA
mgnify:CR=1 FL=1|jgi:formate dehydrogenase gamma subunit|tara:strand:+ start:6042 stop:6911 length:870 start_codon:yes stop_codon:yes gene_type:complete